MTEKLKAESKPVTLAELKEYFFTHYSCIEMNLTDIELTKWMSQGYVKDLPVHTMADSLSDYLLANGAFAQE